MARAPSSACANKALCVLIARCAGVAPTRVTVVRGARSRDKVVLVEGVDQASIGAARTSPP